MTGLAWRRDGDGWILLAGRRRFGRVVPDRSHPGVYRSALSGGRLSDMANLSWTKNAVVLVAEREIEWDERQRRAIDPSKCPEKRGVFGGPSSLARQNGHPATYIAGLVGANRHASEEAKCGF
ncbi:MAG: hypothetical protein ACRECV_10325 [Xanthobacteraceae bacterium]